MEDFQSYVYKFENTQNKNMNFEQVFSNIKAFMQKEPTGKYKLMFGTDSQVYSKSTLFITGIVIQREGKGAWACLHKTSIPRQMTNLHEKISYETSLTEEIVSFFDEKKKDELINIILPNIYKGATFAMEGHIDIGAENKNKTRVFVKEMVSRMQSIGVEPKIKPDSYVASGYANRFTK